MKTVLVTGATGFIGTNLCMQLLNKGNRVIGLDNFYCSQRSRLQNLEVFENFSFFEHDIRLPMDFNERIEDIYHLACPGRHPLHQLIEDPVFVMQTNADGIINIVEVARKHQAKMLYTSTAEVYGIPDIIPTPETNWGNTNPVGARSSYDESKRFGDAYCKAAREKWAMDIKIVRVFNCYGPFMDDLEGRVIPAFIMQALRQEPLTVYGNGSQIRSFCYVDDTIQGFFHVMSTNQDFWGPVNVGNPHQITIKDLAEVILEMTGSNSSMDHKHAVPLDDPPARIPDIHLARNTLRWHPKINLKEGLKRTIDFYRAFLKL